MTSKCSSLRQKRSTGGIAQHFTLSKLDQSELTQYRKDCRLFVAIQLCSVRLYGQFLLNCHELPTEVTNYLCRQLGLPPVPTVKSPLRKAAVAEQQYLLEQNVILPEQTVMKEW